MPSLFLTHIRKIAICCNKVLRTSDGKNSDCRMKNMKIVEPVYRRKKSSSAKKLFYVQYMIFFRVLCNNLLANLTMHHQLR